MVRVQGHCHSRFFFIIFRLHLLLLFLVVVLYLLPNDVEEPVSFILLQVVLLAEPLHYLFGVVVFENGYLLWFVFYHLDV